MLKIRRIEPFYTKRDGDRLKLVFAYQYFSIVKDDELFHFIPVEGKEIIINLQTLQIENLSDVFVFQKSSRFIRMPLYQLLLVSNIHDHLQVILSDLELEDEKSQVINAVSEEVQTLLENLEESNRIRMIDYALEQRDIDLFNKLTTD
ncbi:MAG: transcriptional regulator [Kurthia sp.]|nr:transcriptional regulator [Candidatus Kurthia equi]